MATPKIPKIPKTDFDNIVTRHAVFVEGHKIKEAEKLVKFYDKLLLKTISQTANTPFQVMKRADLAGFIAGVSETLTDPRLVEKAVDSSIALAKYDSEFTAEAIKKAAENVGVGDFEMTIPSQSQVKSAATARMMTVAGPDGGKLLRGYFGTNMLKNARIATTAIRFGFAAGETNHQIVQRLKEATDMTRSNLMTVVRTGMTHAATSARMDFADRNTDIIEAVKWVSTLDSRTSTQCRSLDGREFPLNRGPRPPAHVNCRSTTTYVFKGKLKELQRGGKRMSRDPATGKGKLVDADETYYSWLKKQPKQFQNSVLGPGKATLFRSKGMTADTFSKMALNRKFIPRTLADMKRYKKTALSGAKPRPKPKQVAPKVVFDDLGGDMHTFAVKNGVQGFVYKFGSNEWKADGGDSFKLGATKEQAVLNLHRSVEAKTKRELKPAVAAAPTTAQKSSHPGMNQSAIEALESNAQDWQQGRIDHRNLDGHISHRKHEGLKDYVLDSFSFNPAMRAMDPIDFDDLDILELDEKRAYLGDFGDWDHAMQSLAEPLKKDLRVFRGQDRSYISSAIKEGDEIFDQTWQSTSTDTITADGFAEGAGDILDIRVKKGHEAIITNGGEREVILKRGTKYRVLKVEEFTGRLAQDGEMLEGSGRRRRRRIVVEAIMR